MPRRPPKHPVVIAPEYLDELRARVEAGPGIAAVAKAARISRQTVWRMLATTGSRAPTADGIEYIRRALARLEPDAPPMPPPIAVVRSRDHHAWIALADRLSADELAKIAAHPEPMIAAARRVGRMKK